MGELLIGCSGWNYGDTTDKEDDRSILSRQQHKEADTIHSFFDTEEMDSIFYEKFYSKMTKGTLLEWLKLEIPVFRYQG